MPRRDKIARAAHVLGSLAIAAWGPACAPARSGAYDAAVGAAARDEGAGRFAEAEADYDRAASAGARARDRDEARWSAAEMAVRAGNVADAARRFEALAGNGLSDHQAEAAYRLAMLRIESGDPERGWQDLEQIPRRFPTHGVAHVAVRHLVQHADEQSPRAGLDEVRALERDLASTELAPLLAFLAAEHLETLGDDRAARDAFGRIADRWPYPFGAFFDDALWHASLIDERLGLYEAAAADLERLVRERETTNIVGSYERSKYVPSMLRLGELYEARLHDRGRAREAYHRLYADFAHSTLRDRALWLEATLWRQDGDLGAACDRLATLVDEFPDSRYVPCAVGECRALKRPAASAAPKECHDYISRAGGRSEEDGKHAGEQGKERDGD